MPQSPIPNPQSLSKYWLLLGVTALAIAGLFSLVLVVARTPALAELPLFAALFHSALVVHVDLSVLLWFLSMACLCWSLLATGVSIIPCLEESALVSFALGMLAIAASPLDSRAEPLMSNYVPVITSPVFFLGISLVLCGVGLMLVKLLSSFPRRRESSPSCGSKEKGFLAQTRSALDSRLRGNDGVLGFGILSSAVIALVAIGTFIFAFRHMPKEIDGQQYYELLFWGGGHVLQFLHTQILLVCWLLIAAALKPDFHIDRRVMLGLFSIGLVCALVVPGVLAMYPVTSMAYHDFFTREMMMAGGIASMLLALYLIRYVWHDLVQVGWMLIWLLFYSVPMFLFSSLALAPLMLTPTSLPYGSEGQITLVKEKIKNMWFWKLPATTALATSLAMSIILFLYGGALGEIIRGQNVVIPAHYHGSIVGVTLGFMGMAYLFLPRFGYRDVSAWRMAYWQPVVYGGGQLLHISGLAWSGGYGVLRKTPGGMEALSGGVKAAMGLMGLGGMIAIVGGFMFVIVVAKSVFCHPRRPTLK